MTQYTTRICELLCDGNDLWEHTSAFIRFSDNDIIAISPESVSPYSPLSGGVRGVTTNRGNGRGQSLCNVGVCVPGTLHLMGHPALSLPPFLCVLCGKPSGKLPHCAHCDL